MELMARPGRYRMRIVVAAGGRSLLDRRNTVEDVECDVPAKGDVKVRIGGGRQ